MKPRSAESMQADPLFANDEGALKRWVRRRSSGVLLVVLSATLLCIASPSAASGGGEEHAASVADLIFPVFNFLLFVGLLWYAAGDTIRDDLRRRRSEVIAILDAGATAKAEAENTHAELTARLGQVDEEAARLRSEMRAVAELERERRRQLAGAAAARVGTDARLIADQETRAARAALREETVAAAVAHTVVLLQRQIRDSDRERFMGEFLSNVRARV